jgi:hypothetical protein
MGKRNKRARTLLKKATMLGEEISPETARRYGIADLLPQKTNTEKIEELKTKNPEPVIEEPVTLEEPTFVVEAPKVEVKKKTTRARKATPRKRKVKTKS